MGASCRHADHLSCIIVPSDTGGHALRYQLVFCPEGGAVSGRGDQQGYPIKRWLIAGSGMTMIVLPSRTLSAR